MKASLGLVAPVIAVTMLFASAAHADPKTDPKPAPAKDAAPKSDGDALPEKTTSLAIAATPMLPIGDLSNAFGIGIGGMLEGNFQLHPKASIVARTGYVHHFPKDGIEANLGVVPIWGGGRYGFTGVEGPYIEGLLGPTVLIASANTRFGRVSDTEVKVGMSFGGGYRIGKLDIGGRFVFYDVGRAGDSAGLMASIGYSFAAF